MNHYEQFKDAIAQAGLRYNVFVIPDRIVLIVYKGHSPIEVGTRITFTPDGALLRIENDESEDH